MWDASCTVLSFNILHNILYIERIILFIFFMFIYITAGLAVYILSVLLRLLYILTFFCTYLFFEGCRVTPVHPR